MGAGLSQDKASETNKGEPINNASQSSNTDTKANHTTKQVSLPHNCDDILKHADAPVDRSPAKKLFKQLHAGVLLDQNKKKYWVEKQSNRNCFMVFAQDLSVVWAEDNRYWRWPLITKAEDDSSFWRHCPLLKESSDECHAVAELLNVCWLEVSGRFDQMANLSPGTIYEVVFVVKLTHDAYGWENHPVNLILTLPDGSRKERKENLMQKPRGKWIDIPVGEFETTAEMDGEMSFSLKELGGQWKKGLLIKGVTIRPKASVL